MSEVEARFVKRGLWTRLDEGPVVGKTITADVQTEDGLYRQQQALLRTLPTPASLLADSTKLWLFWRKRVNGAFLRSMLPLFLALAFSIGTVAVGIFSSYIVTGNDLQVLVSSPLCGPLDIDPSVDGYTDNIYGIWQYEAKVTAIGKSYAQDCYQIDSQLPTRCGIFTRPYIPFSQKRVSCPFGSMCMRDNGDLSAVQLDSGLVNLNDGFGLNLASKDQVKFRRRTTCAVLESRTTIVDATDYPDISHEPYPGEELLVVHYGDITYDTAWPNATFVHSLAASNMTNSYQKEYVTAYGNSAWVDMNDFIPLPEMEDPNADHVIVMVWKNQVGYGSVIDDIFFAAHDANIVETVRGRNETYYYSDTPASAMGCTQQYQFCYAREGKPEYCSELAGLPGKVIPEDYPDSSDVQRAAIQLLITSTLLFDISDAGLGTLKAEDLAGGSGYVEALPDDQWTREVAGWESFAWAALQTAVSDYAVGPAVREAATGAYVRNETTAGEKQLCQVQRLRKAGGFVTINAFGLAFIAAVSIFVAILDFMLLRFMITLSRFRRAMAPKLDRWIQDGVFQLQRRAYEAQGEGSWQHIDKEIPVTSSNEKLKDLPLSSVQSLKMSIAHTDCANCSQKKLLSMDSWASGLTTVENKSQNGSKC